MAAITTANALTDFDMCLALAQVSIDTQMEYAWKAWKRRSGFQDKIKIFKLKQGDKVINSNYGVEATFAPLTVSLTVPDGKIGQVQVNLLLTSGTVTYYDEATEEKATYPIDNWGVSFITDLDKKPVDLKALQQIDPAAAGVAQEVIASTGLPDSVFSIEYLFLKFTEVDLMLADNKNVKIPTDVPSSARNKALSTLNLLLQGELSEYILGTVVRRNNRQATPTFALTDFVFDVHANWSAAPASTLSYLGQLAGRGLPPDTSAARLALKDAWVRPEQLDGREANVSGIMAIGKNVFMEKYLIPRVKEALRDFEFPTAFAGIGFGHQSGYTGPEPKRNGLGWTFSEGVNGGRIESGFIKMQFTVDQGYELTLTAQPSSNQLAISGRLWSKVHYDGMTWLATDIGNHTEWIYVDGHQNISGALNLTGNGTAADFNLESRLEYKLGDPVIDNREVGGFSNVTEALGSAFKALGLFPSTPSELISTAQSQASEILKGYLQQALSRLTMDLSQHTFVPPGGGVFTFQNPAFSNAGDLFFEVIYRAP